MPLPAAVEKGDASGAAAPSASPLWERAGHEGVTSWYRARVHYPPAAFPICIVWPRSTARAAKRSPIGAASWSKPTRSAVAERGAVDVAAHQQVRRPGAPAAGAQVALRFGQPAGAGEEQGEGEVRGGLREDARRVADDDAPRGRRRHVDVVYPTAMVLMTRRRGAAPSSCASMRSVSRQSRPSASETARRSASAGGVSPGQTSTSHPAWASLSSAGPGSRRVTKTRMAAELLRRRRGDMPLTADHPGSASPERRTRPFLEKIHAGRRCHGT